MKTREEEIKEIMHFNKKEELARKLLNSWDEKSDLLHKLKDAEQRHKEELEELQEEFNEKIYEEWEKNNAKYIERYLKENLRTELEEGDNCDVRTVRVSLTLDDGESYFGESNNIYFKDYD